jgi:hypothetical protein
MRFDTSSAVGIMCALVLLVSGMPACGQAAAVPRDFALRLTSAARGPARTPPDIAWVDINAAGNASLSEMPGKSGRLPATQIKLAPDALARIYSAIQDQRFFELRPLYEDPTIRDGDQAEITITANGRTYTVQTVNITVYAFDRVTIAIDRELPIERRIQYNALREPSYKVIER